MAPLLQSKAFMGKIRPLLDMYDELRVLLSEEKEITLPSIAVVGKQSAGKSTVLERISGLQLPRGDGMVTKCPLLMQLRRRGDFKESAAGSSNNQPAESIRIGTDAANLKAITRTEVPGMIEEISEQLLDEASAEEKEFGIAQTPIILQVTGPGLPDLTLIDLPGLYQLNTETNLPIEGLEAFFKRLYMRHMRSDECVLVVVMPATGTSLRCQSESQSTV